MDTAFLVLAGLTVWDVVSTLYVLDKGGREANPLLAKLFAEVAAKYSLPAVKIAFLAMMWFLWPHLPLEAKVVICVLYAAVGINNLKVILKLR